VDVDTLARTIQTILAPVVMVTACAIILGGLWGHIAAINDRLRLMNRERLELWRASSTDAYTSERLLQIDTQAPQLLRRHRLVLDAIVTIYAAMLVYLVSMLAIAGSTLLKIPASLALFLFLIGTLLALGGLLVAIFELRASQSALEWETRQVASLKR